MRALISLCSTSRTIPRSTVRPIEHKDHLQKLKHADASSLTRLLIGAEMRISYLRQLIKAELYPTCTLNELNQPCNKLNLSDLNHQNQL